MTDIYLHTVDKQSMLDALTDAGLTHKGEACSTHEVAVAMIGTLSRPTGTTLTDDDGIEYPEMESISGYHCNIRTDSQAVIDDLEFVMIDVTSPTVEWA